MQQLKIWIVIKQSTNLELNEPIDGVVMNLKDLTHSQHDRIPSTTPGAEPPRGAKDSGSARSHSTHLETSSQKRP